jgi:hypothetical protein
VKPFLTLSLLALAACPGAIDDPSRFELPPDGEQDPVEDAGTPSASRDAALDAAPWDAKASIRDDAAVLDAARDAQPATISDAAPQPDASSCNFRQLMTNKCGSASCHGNGGAAAGLDLISDGLAARVGTRQGAGACGDFPLIDREQPQNSALYRKLTDTACGPRMPLGGALSLAEQQCVLSWIEGL